ncbi:MAG: cyanophycinase [Acidobacteriota bacterium]
MRAVRHTLVFLSVAVLAVAHASATHGDLVLIGGGEVESTEAIRKIVELAGGPQAPIVILPTASEDPESLTWYTRRFVEGGNATNATTLALKTREDAARPEFVEAVRNARAIFFGGGDQVRLTDALLDTPVGDAIVAAFERGVVIGGTSAGTACQSARMITGEGNFEVIRAGAVELKRGFGFFPGVIVDQHFVARQRQNRLFTVILEHPDLLGVGIDEDTAVWVKPNGTFEVLGVGTVIVIDAKPATVERRVGADAVTMLAAQGLKVHVLLHGDRFDVRRRKVIR